MKKWTKGLLATAFAGAIILTGCSSMTQIENKSDEILYNGGSIVAVGDYLFYGNGYASGVSDYSTTSDSEYKTAQGYSYLSRINTESGSWDKYSNENSSDKISDKVAGFEASYMFVCGDYVYFATPNQHKTSENKYVWSYVTFSRVGINGGKTEEIYTTEAYDSSTAEFRALKYNGKNYLVIFDGTNLVKVELGKKCTATKLNSTTITSIALPAEGETWDGDIYYTTAKTTSVGQTGNTAYKVNIESNETKTKFNKNGYSITFTGRIGNKLFYTYKNESNSNLNSETFVYDTEVNVGDLSDTNRFYAGTISDIISVATDNTTYAGYTFNVTVDSATQVMYYNQLNNETTVFIDSDAEYSNFVASNGTYFYYMTESDIICKTIDTNEETTIVSDMTIKNDNFGYDFYYTNGEATNLKSIYFYAQIPSEDEEEEEETDENYYLYRVSANGGDPVLISKN